jgi:CO/xanthine dehydrogenase FAD-binding subunit
VRGDLTGFTVERPRRLAAALAALAERDRPTPIAGGTDLFVALNEGRAPGSRWLDLSRLDELRGIERRRTGLRLGARTTFTELARSRTVARLAPVLVDMARTVGAVAIQNRGTLGGSLGNASPASDPAPVLLALGAEVELARREGRRIERRAVALETFFTGYRTTAARADELIVAVSIPAASLDGWRYAYRKVGTRRAQTISKVVAAAGVALAGRPRRLRAARIAFGSVAPVSLRCPAAERALAGRRLDLEAIAAARAALLAEDIRPIDDLRSTAAYRARISSRVLAALLAELGGVAERALAAAL